VFNQFDTQLFTCIMLRTFVRALWRGNVQRNNNITSPLQHFQPHQQQRNLAALPIFSHSGITSITSKEAQKEQSERVLHSTVKAENKKGSPHKFRLVANGVRGLSVWEAIEYLSAHPRQRLAGIIKTLIQSAAANAVHNYGMNQHRLLVDNVLIDKGRYLQRLSYHSKGRFGVKHKTYSHVKVIVAEVERTNFGRLNPYRANANNISSTATNDIKSDDNSVLNTSNQVELEPVENESQFEPLVIKTQHGDREIGSTRPDTIIRGLKRRRQEKKVRVTDDRLGKRGLRDSTRLMRMAYLDHLQERGVNI